MYLAVVDIQEAVKARVNEIQTRVPAVFQSTNRKCYAPLCYAVVIRATVNGGRTRIARNNLAKIKFYRIFLRRGGGLYRVFLDFIELAASAVVPQITNFEVISPPNSKSFRCF